MTDLGAMEVVTRPGWAGALTGCEVLETGVQGLKGQQSTGWSHPGQGGCGGATIRTE